MVGISSMRTPFKQNGYSGQNGVAFRIEKASLLAQCKWSVVASLGCFQCLFLDDNHTCLLSASSDGNTSKVGDKEENTFSWNMMLPAVYTFNVEM